MSAARWVAPVGDERAAVACILNSRRVIAVHRRPDASRVEVAQIGTPAIAWVVVWTGGREAEWPELFPEFHLARIELGPTGRQQSWIFHGPDADRWQELLLAWDLPSVPRTGLIA